MLTKVAALWMTRLSEGGTLGGVLPLDPLRVPIDTRGHLADLAARGRALGFFPAAEVEGGLPAEFGALVNAIAEEEKLARLVMGELEAAVAGGTLTPEQRERIDAHLMALERCWLSEKGIPGRPWFRSLYSASDEDSGYAAWMLPGMRWAIEHKDAEELAAQVTACVQVFAKLKAEMLGIGQALGSAGGSGEGGQ